MSFYLTVHCDVKKGKKFEILKKVISYITRYTRAHVSMLETY